MCAETWSHTHTSFLCEFWPFYWDTHEQSDTFWSCALITSSRLILGQRWTQLTTDYWLVQLVTVISCRVIWRWPCCSQTAANLAAPEVIIQLFTLRQAGGDECRKRAYWFKSPSQATDSGFSAGRPECCLKLRSHNTQTLKIHLINQVSAHPARCDCLISYRARRPCSYRPGIMALKLISDS